MNFPLTATVAAFAAYTGFNVTGDVVKVVNPEPRALVLNQLQYDPATETVTQQLSGNIAASWSVRIHRSVNRVSQVLCEGQSETRGIYTGQESTWTVSDWAGDDCPALQPGDEGRAAWEYVNDAGTLVTVIGIFTVPDEVQSEG